MQKGMQTPISPEGGASLAPAAFDIATQVTPLGPESRIARAAIPERSVIPESRQASIDTLKKEGIDVSAGQARGSTALRTAESQLGTAPFSGDKATEQFNTQMRQFTRAALRRVGEDSDRATPDVIDRAFTRIGNEFDRLQQNTVIPDKDLATEIGEARDNYIQLTSPYNRAEAIPNIGNRISMYVHKDIPIPGDVYKATRSQLDKLRRGTTDPVVKETLTDYIDALDGAMERTLQKTNPADLGKWQEVRRQYRNMLIIEKALPAGETGAEGLITPAKLRQAALAKNKRMFRRGKDDFSELALAGEHILSPVKTSKTSERAMIGAVPAEIAAGTVAGISGNIPLAASLYGTTFAPGLAGRALLSSPVQNFLKKGYGEMQHSGVIPQELLARGGIQELLGRLGSQ
jgi:hypothetical protein